MIFKADAEYHARLAQKLRDAGFDIALDGRTGAARMTAIPEDVCALFSKRSKAGEQWARLMAAKEGVEWDDLSREQQEQRVKRYTQDVPGQQAKGQKDDIADLKDWRRQAKELGWETPAILSSTMACKARRCSRRVKTFFTNWRQQFDPAPESREHYPHLHYKPRSIPWLCP